MALFKKTYEMVGSGEHLVEATNATIQFGGLRDLQIAGQGTGAAHRASVLRPTNLGTERRSGVSVVPRAGHVGTRDYVASEEITSPGSSHR